MKRSLFFAVLLALLTALPAAVSAQQNVQRVNVKLDKALVGLTPKVRDWVLSPEIQFTLIDGKVVSPTIHLKRGWTVPSWKGVVDSHKLTVRADRLTGSLVAKIHSATTVAGTFDITIDATIADSVVRGTHLTSKAGAEKRTGQLTGTVVPDVISGDPAQDGVWTVHLAKALPRGEVLSLYIDRHDGKFSAFAFSPDFTRRPMDVDASRLRFVDSKLSGSVTVTRLNKANDGTRSTFGQYRIDAAVGGAMVRGTFQGTTVNDQPVEGDVWGEIRHRRPIPGNPTVWIKCEGGYTGGAMWQNRVFLQCTLKDGRFVKGTASNNKGVFKATLADAKLTFGRNTVNGVMRSTVLSSGSVTEGDYTFKLKGMRAGDVMYGRFYTQLGGKEVQTGYFVGGIRR